MQTSRLQPVYAGNHLCPVATTRREPVLPVVHMFAVAPQQCSSSLKAAAILATRQCILPRRAGIFFLGYAVLQVPSNLILLRVGAPTWLGVTIVAWGVVAALFAALRNTAEFYILRFLLGITECGAFPGEHCDLIHSSQQYVCWTASHAVEQSVKPKLLTRIFYF